MPPPNRLIDLAGQRFGAWRVMERAPNGYGQNSGARWRCRCADCGREKDIAGYDLRRGRARPCKCAQQRRQVRGGDGLLIRAAAADDEEGGG
jgi:hypothetical protein